MRAAALACLLLVALAAPASAGAPASLSNFTAWTTSPTQAAFVAASAGGRRGYLWVQRIGAFRPSLLRSTPPIGLEEIDELAPGPRGSWAAVERTQGAVRLDVVSARGGGARVATTGAVRQVFGDGTFLGYLSATPAGAIRLFEVTGARSRLVATLTGVTSPQGAVTAHGMLAVRETNGNVDVFTTRGQRLATIKANAASVGLGAARVVVRTRARRLAVYGLRGGLVHDWPLGVAGWSAGLATDGRYAVYLGANKAVRGVRLSNGRDRILARAGTGFYFDGVALERAGAVVPLTQGRTVTLRLVPRSALRAALG